MTSASTAHTLGYITARIDQLPKLVVQYRANEAALRRLATSRPTRNARATETAIERREHDRYIAETSAAFASDRGKRVVGHLVAERNLLVRLAEAKRLGQARPELHERLAAVRAEIRAELSWSHQSV